MSQDWHYVLTPQAARDMRGLDLPARQRVFDALDRYVANRHANVRMLRGRQDEWRMRIGDWRVRFRPDYQAHLVVVLRVRHRREAYRA